MIMCLELMREMMRGVRICYFIEGCYEVAFGFFFFYIGRDIDHLLNFLYKFSTIPIQLLFLHRRAWFSYQNILKKCK